LERTTIARPYAKAIFDLAQRKGNLQDWSEMLGVAMAAVSEPQVARLIDDPRVDTQRVIDLVLTIAGPRLTEQGKNLIRLLAEKDRLPLLPEIRQVYDTLRAEAERTLEAEVISAKPLTSEQEQRIAEMLRTRLHREVELRTTTDPSLIGGVIIHAGDLVIDASAQGQLARLASTLSR
jgi:F-type H+-transporting ATPase subunit delta